MYMVAKSHYGKRRNLRIVDKFTFFLLHVKYNIKSYMVFRRTRKDLKDFKLFGKTDTTEKCKTSASFIHIVEH